MVARLGSVKDAAKMLNVSEPAVSQALTALRQHLGDPLIMRNGATMSLTTAGVKLLPVASQMVALGAEAQAAVRSGQGLPEQLRLVTTSPIAEFVAGSLTDAFSRRFAQPVEASAGVAAEDEMAVLVVNRLADMALGPLLTDKELVSEPVFRYHMVAVASPHDSLKGSASGWPWLVDPSGIDPSSDVSRLLARLGVAENRIRVFPNATAAWAAAASGRGRRPGRRAPAPAAGPPGRASGRGDAGDADGGHLVRHHAASRAAAHHRRVAAALPEHAGSHEADALPRQRRPPVKVPPPGLRHHLELIGVTARRSLPAKRTGPCAR